MKMQLSPEQMDLLGYNTELMGLFGLSWPEKVASFISKQLKGTAEAKKLKSFWGAGGKNVTLVKNLHNEYMALLAQGFKAANFTIQPNSAGAGGSFDQNSINIASRIAGKTNVSTVIILEFLRALFVLARDGKIPMAKWNPSGYAKSTELRKTFSTEKGVLEAAETTGKYVKIAMVLASLGVGAYILTQLKGFSNVKK